jgi:hypothetical protein
MGTTIEELVKAIELTNNIKTVEYNTATGLWCIKYKPNLKPDIVTTDELMNCFITNE